jgi:hypothetical protein
MLQRFYLLTTALLLVVFSWAQTASLNTNSINATAKPEDIILKDSLPVLTFSGSVDVYYKYDFAKTRSNTYTSFTNSQNTFSLGMATLKVVHNGKKVSTLIDLGFGERASDFSYNDNGILSAIKQMYVSYSPATWIKFTAGTWATHIGYEVLDPQLNRNYSMSYMFTNGPFSHTGIKMEASKGNHGLMIGISNATDFRIVPDNQINKIFLIAQYSYAPNDKMKVYLNYAGGQNPDTSKTRQFDIVCTSKFSEKFNIAYNGTYNSTKLWDGFKNMASKNWWGSAIYLNYDPQNWLGVTLREEYFSDKDHLKLPTSVTRASIVTSTLSANFKVEGFTFISEFRVDKSSEQIFLSSSGAATKSTANILFAAIYSF